MTKQDGKWTLKQDHSYYYQVQTQLNVCQLEFGDFVVWTENGITTERIIRAVDFFEHILEDVQHFFMYGMLPEIIGKWYTRRPIADSSGVVPMLSSNSNRAGAGTEEVTKSWCYCDQPEFGQIIRCDNAQCQIEWFHCDCLRIRSIPRGKWYCPSCRTLSQFTRKRRMKIS